VDDRTILRFNYGQFFQQPKSPGSLHLVPLPRVQGEVGGYFVGFGNPNLRPERTTAYEVGAAAPDRVQLSVST
jgi:outer membrane receptor protein involved in Fe transport